MLDVENLVRRAQRKDAEAFSQLYEAYFDRIYRYCRMKLSNEMEAEDITQQVFIKALNSICSYQCKGVPFSAWLFRIAHNQVVDHFRRQSKRSTVQIDGLPLAARDDPEKLVECRLETERVTEAAKNLTDAQQEVISLRFASQLSIAEVAKVMGKSEGAIKALQHSAIMSLRKVLVVAEP